MYKGKSSKYEQDRVKIPKQIDLIPLILQHIKITKYKYCTWTVPRIDKLINFDLLIFTHIRVWVKEQIKNLAIA